ncbi:hypothetical protein BCR35DRAFT_121143 [Leucosporidium creatinivorum]|uniref:Extracellular membrane protein CFEM domain-containing protein n=1 Tax=Leucosporidium creatinivorum TaxID=106004 RepID=A0A1Y2EYC3_9BASI|nr:hypothetical protein BCR35DRAFT_121143 [Leucosporidium creatinivorum]
MHYTLPLLALLPLASALSTQQEALVVREVSLALSSDVVGLQKRAASSSTYLASIFSLVTSGCNSTCALATQDFACAALPSQSSIAQCACSAQAIGDVRSCAACISADSKTSKKNETGVVEDYNAYVDLCTSEGLASVTGTVQVGASTSSLPRTSLGRNSTHAASASATKSDAAASSKATYNPDQSVTSVAKVPSLVASGVSVSSGGQAVASASGSPSSGGERVVVGLGAVVMGLVGVVALL